MSNNHFRVTAYHPTEDITILIAASASTTNYSN